MKQKQYFEGFAHGFGRVPETSANRLSKSIEKARSRVGQSLYRIFESVLPAESVQGRVGERKRSYDSATTLFGMVSQVFMGGSLRTAVRELQAVDELLGRPIRSGNTGSYSEARSRLSEDTVEQVVNRLDSMTPRNGRSGRVLSVDATGVQLDDTVENLKLFDYAACQKPGCGFPVMQQVALMDLGSGALTDVVATAQRDGESPLFEAGAGAVMRLNSSRDQRALRQSDDVVVTWKRPDFSAIPLHLFKEQWAQLPEELSVRLVRYRVEQRGFRSREILLATPLMDASAEELAELYHRRWEIETEFRHIKTTMGMDHMHVKSPEMTYKQMYAFFLAHNLLRWLMLKAALQNQADPTRLSFKGALDAVRIWACQMSQLKRKHFNQMMDTLLQVIAKYLVPIRPDRIEPRRLKKRLKRFTLLTFPRRDDLPDDEFFKSGLS